MRSDGLEMGLQRAFGDFGAAFHDGGGHMMQQNSFPFSRAIPHLQQFFTNRFPSGAFAARCYASSSIAAIAANNPARLGSFSCNDQAPCAASMAGLPLLHRFNRLEHVIYSSLGHTLTYFSPCPPPETAWKGKSAIRHAADIPAIPSKVCSNFALTVLQHSVAGWNDV